MNRNTAFQVGQVIMDGQVPGVVVKAMKRTQAGYVVWGTRDLATARAWEQQGYRADYLVYKTPASALYSGQVKISA